MKSDALNRGYFSCAELVAMAYEVPELYSEIENDLGVEAAWNLTTHYGGVELFVPVSKRLEYSRVSQLLGVNTARWFSERFGWGNLYIPKGHGSRKFKCLFDVYKKKCEGKSHRNIAQSLDVSIKTVERNVQMLKHVNLLPKGETK